MKRTEFLAILLVALGLMVCQAEFAKAAPMGTAWTYQGRLVDANEAADGLYDFEFKLYDDPCTGTQQGGTIVEDDLDVIDGYFTVVLDFGAVFDGDARWLEIAVRPGASVGAHDILSPRQETTPAPYAIYAQNAEDANTIDGLDASQFAGSLHVHPGEDITSGTVHTNRYSAYNDLGLEGYLGNAAGDLARNNGVLQATLNADRLDSLNESAFFRLAQNEVVTGRPAFNGGVTGSTSPFLVDSTYRVTGLNADYLDGFHEGSFFRLSQNESVTGRPSFLGGVSGSTPPFYVDSTYVVAGLNADYLDGYHQTSFFNLAQNETVTGRPFFNGGTSGSTPPFYVDSTMIVASLNADLLDGQHSTAFATSGHNHDAAYVNITGDTMTGSLDATWPGANFYAVKGSGQLGPTNGYLGVQGQTGYDGVTSTYWVGREIGVAGISTGGSTTDNYGVLGHASQAGVRGEYSGDPNNYGELGRSGYGVYGTGTSRGGNFVGGTYGVYGNGTSYAGYFLGGNYGVRSQGTTYGTYSSAVPTGTGTAYGTYSRADHSGDASGTTYGVYSLSYGSGVGSAYGIYAYSSKASTTTSGTGYGGYFTSDNDSPGNSYGIYSRAIGSGGGTNYGIYATASSGTTNYAGFFVGDVVVDSGGTTALAIKLQPDGLNNNPLIAMYDDDNEMKVRIVARETTTTEGAEMKMYDEDGTNTIEFDAEYASDGGGYLALRNGDGVTTIYLDSDYAGDGRITTEELRITGGSDLSEQFDIQGAKDVVKPGMLVCIDSKRAGKLVVSRSAYDKKVAGIISGAGGVKPGMMMGQDGSQADGDYPVALTGRVYCWADASKGSIEPGDLLTTSSTPGHAMKVSNHNKALGAIIGKSMTSLEKGKGLVLVLVSLQ